MNVFYKINPLLQLLPAPSALSTFFVVWRSAPAYGYAGFDRSYCSTEYAKGNNAYSDGQCHEYDIDQLKSNGRDPREGMRVFNTGNALGNIGLAAV